ncbi:hypothetical protein LSH36_554g01058 [Paralvinella palmiformis]|uniref:Uncharacterized protein n=1 Tax=Paralvinella palmiformis TaxID=53620 RepID=A0AAD9J6J9_9ANNE|nr:hypothetical protein LSH36_554g01058 [Paralvinella palmiformis]
MGRVMTLRRLQLGATFALPNCVNALVHYFFALDFCHSVCPLVLCFFTRVRLQLTRAWSTSWFGVGPRSDGTMSDMLIAAGGQLYRSPSVRVYPAQPARRPIFGSENGAETSSAVLLGSLRLVDETNYEPGVCLCVSVCVCGRA